MTDFDLPTLFDRFRTLRAAVIGDFAVDCYYTLQTETGENSLETGLPVHWGGRMQTSPGGAGNVVQNLAALGVGAIRAFGAVGPDAFGRELRHLLQRVNVDTSGLLTVETGWDTCVYTKPMREGREGNRLDFGTQNALSEAVFGQLLAELERALPTLDVLILNQQFPAPLLDAARTVRLNELLLNHPNCQYVADMRHVGHHLRQIPLKVNTAELARMLNVPEASEEDEDWCRQHSRQLAGRLSAPVILTRGAAGILYVDTAESASVAGLPLAGPLDTVGAGDTVVAAYAACRGAGARPPEAIALANLAAAVTVQKLGQTGTANREEISELANGELANSFARLPRNS